jgi:hypothetical protein
MSEEAKKAIRGVVRWLEKIGRGIRFGEWEWLRNRLGEKAREGRKEARESEHVQSIETTLRRVKKI